MAFDLTNPALAYDQLPQTDPMTGILVSLPPHIKFFKNPALRAQQFAQDASQAVQPSISTVEGQIAPPAITPSSFVEGESFDPGSVGPGQDVTTPEMGTTPTPRLPRFFQPKFQDVSHGPYGTPVPVNLAETKLGKLLHIGLGFAQGFANAAGQPNIAQGMEAAREIPYQNAARQMQLQSGLVQQQLQQQQLAMLPYQRLQAMAALQKEQGEAVKAPYIPVRGVGVWNPVTQRMMPGTAPAAKDQNPDAQAFDARTRILQGNPQPGDQQIVDAWTAQKQAAQDVRPDPQASLKADFQALTSKIADEITPDAMSSLPKFTAVVNSSGKLTPDEKRRVISYVAANSTPMSQGSTANLRIGGLAETRGMPVTDTKTGVTAPMSWADYNTLRKAEPGRYVSPQYDPDTQLAVKAWRDLAPGGKTGTQITSYNTFLRHIGDMYDAISELRNSKYQDWNRPMNWLAQHRGDPRVQRFLAKLEPVQKEFESFLLNNRALYSEDREDAKRLLDQNSSPAAMYGVAESLVHTGRARLDELNNSFKRATGEDIPNMISPEAGAAQQKVAPTAGKASPRTAGKYAPGFSPD